MYIGLQVKYRYCFQVFIILESYRQIFEKYTYTNFHKKDGQFNRTTFEITELC